MLRPRREAERWQRAAACGRDAKASPMTECASVPRSWRPAVPRIITATITRTARRRIGAKICLEMRFRSYDVQYRQIAADSAVRGLRSEFNRPGTAL